jgi:hypothetical protein
MSAIAKQIDALDTELFSFLEAQTTEWDRRALLALHSAVADRCGSFAYLEVGSYRGGSLQAVMRDARCTSVISIDKRTTDTPDERGSATYDNNTTEHMFELLQEIPDVDLDKLTTLDATTETLSALDLPARPSYCFIDGEHTHDAVLRDARFCADAIGSGGVIAFHDYVIVGSAISAFLRENWREISFALAFTGPSTPGAPCGVLALEIGGLGLLKHPAVERAISSRWHSDVWTLVNRPRRTALPFLLAWALMPAADSFVAQARQGFREYVRR